MHNALTEQELEALCQSINAHSTADPERWTLHAVDMRTQPGSNTNKWVLLAFDNVTRRYYTARTLEQWILATHNAADGHDAQTDAQWGELLDGIDAHSDADPELWVLHCVHAHNGAKLLFVFNNTTEQYTPVTNATQWEQLTQ